MDKLGDLLKQAGVKAPRPEKTLTAHRKLGLKALNRRFTVPAIAPRDLTVEKPDLNAGMLIPASKMIVDAKGRPTSHSRVPVTLTLVEKRFRAWKRTRTIQKGS